MKYIVDSNKTVEQACEDLQAAVKDHQFGVLHVHDLKATLNSKGIDFSNDCKVFEVCNPKKASAVLTEDMSLNMALPCRISVWAENGKTNIGMISPKRMLASLSDSPELARIADEVEQTSIAIIQQSR